MTNQDVIHQIVKRDHIFEQFLGDSDTETIGIHKTLTKFVLLGIKHGSEEVSHLILELIHIFLHLLGHFASTDCYEQLLLVLPQLREHIFGKLIG